MEISKSDTIVNDEGKSMGLGFRMGLAFLSLFFLFMIGFMAIGLILGLPYIVIVFIVTILVLIQYLISPLIVKLIYRIDWVGLDSLDPAHRKYIERVCEANEIRTPRFGVIHDDNPNAFCFGWTRNRSFLVLTDGIDKYLDKREKKAVIGHELGHIVHNDFVIMTLISMVPLVFYIIGRSCLESTKHSSGNNKGAGAIVLIGLISLLIYVITEFIVLLVSRYREYWADGYSARSTRDPNSLSSALVKIAYGLASEGKGNARRRQIKFENSLMISDPRSGRSLAFNSKALTGKENFSGDDLKEAMAWDMWNPWAKWLELKSSHPLPAKRIMVLDKIAEDMGELPLVNFDLKQPESYWDEFLLDISAGYGWLLAFPVSIAYMILGSVIFGPGISIPSGIGLMMSIVGFSLLVYVQKYRYPLDFKKRNLEFLLDDPKASPIRGIPVEVEGKIIGRGMPGLFFNEDLKIDDGTALMLIDYNQVLRIMNLIEGLFRTEKRVGKSVKITGWYRRKITPYIELYRMDWGDGAKKMWTRPGMIFFLVLLGVVGLVVHLVNPLTYLITGVFIFIFISYLKIVQRKFEKDMQTRMEMGPHPYDHHGSVGETLKKFRMVSLSKPVGTDFFPNEDETEPVMISITVACPNCGKEQKVFLSRSGEPHRCSYCGLLAQVDLPGVRI
jgi:heat shock protein HtpX